MAENNSVHKEKNKTQEEILKAETKEEDVNVVATVTEADSEPEEEKEPEGLGDGVEIGTVEILETDRPKATDLDFQHCKIIK